jgi:phosphatidylglycerophosphate synthase
MKRKSLSWKSKIKSILSPFEDMLMPKLVPKVPFWINTRPLTMMTILWCFLVILFSYLAKDNLLWLWLVSLVIIFHYITDYLDGNIGRLRNEGFVKWGYYMDHLLDYFFLCSILIGYYFIVPPNYHTLFLFIIVFACGYMVSSFIAYAVNDNFRYAYFGIGPIEFQLSFIIINSLIISFGKSFLALCLPYFLAVFVLGFICVVYITQKDLFKEDMENKNSKKK